VTTGFTHGNRYYGPADVKSVVVNIDRAVNGNYPALKFALDGFVHAVTVFANVSTAGTNLIQAALVNAGAAGAGTTVVGQVSSGTLVAGSAYALTISPSAGAEVFAAGELAVVQLTTENVATDISVQIDWAYG
jgi:hypothetical protein